MPDSGGGAPRPRGHVPGDPRAHQPAAHERLARGGHPDLGDVELAWRVHKPQAGAQDPAVAVPHQDQRQTTTVGMRPGSCRPPGSRRSPWATWARPSWTRCAIPWSDVLAVGRLQLPAALDALGLPAGLGRSRRTGRGPRGLARQLRELPRGRSHVYENTQVGLRVQRQSDQREELAGRPRTWWRAARAVGFTTPAPRAVHGGVVEEPPGGPGVRGQP
ncbi:hypothetical protein QJS66_05540 [Kocuria rhizophila]|nr:hypothetical protein QJS66_05540 [Kocuria rhizophila]